MALARLRRKPEKTEGQGNCAFNAFTLGLCNALVFSQIERALGAANTDLNIRFKRFVRHAATSLKVQADWRSVTAELIRLRREDPVSLQQLMAPVFRELSVNIALKPADSFYHFQRTISCILGAFSDYRRIYLNLPVKFTEDTFCRHDFIHAEFERVCRMNVNEDARLEIIKNWWRDSGYQNFLKAMSCEGEWAGDLELARLARYFGVALEVLSDGYDEPYTIYGSFGRFPFLHGDLGKGIDEKDQLIIMSSLYERFILKDGLEHMNDQGIEFSLSDINLICRRLDAVPHFELVRVFVNEHCMELKGMLVPRDWPPTLLEELIQRNVIGSSRDNKGFVFAMNAQDAVIYLNEIPHCKKIKEICRKNFEARPRLVLCNHRGEHWENTVALPDPFIKEMIQRSSIFSKNWLPYTMSNQFFSAAIMRRCSDEDVTKKFT